MGQSQTDLYLESMIRRVELRTQTVKDKGERIIENYLKHSRFKDHESEANRIWLDQFAAEGIGFDIACGDFLIGEVVQAIGIDGTKTQHGTDWAVDIADLKFQDDNTLDYIVSNYIDCAPAPLPAFTEWVRVLKPGGVLAAVCRDSDTYTTELGALRNIRRHSCYTDKTLRHYMTRAGLINVKIVKHPKTESLRAHGTKA